MQWCGEGYGCQLRGRPRIPLAGFPIVKITQHENQSVSGKYRCHSTAGFRTQARPPLQPSRDRQGVVYPPKQPDESPAGCMATRRRNALQNALCDEGIHPTPSRSRLGVDFAQNSRSDASPASKPSEFTGCETGRSPCPRAGSRIGCPSSRFRPALFIIPPGES